MPKADLIPHLFRTEFGKITAVLCKSLGIEHLETAEDIAGATFLSALETWPYRGLPDNPTAWLYRVAKNKARTLLARNQLFSGKIAPELKAVSQDQSQGQEIFDIELSPQQITDSQLQMIFAVCHPCIPAEGQIGLALRVLCGFSIEEIADAFLTNKETINKRLFRTREKLREESVQIRLPDEKELAARLEMVLRTLYLLFSEGYYSESREEVIREDLCFEAMRLTYLLLDNPFTGQPAAHALLALMCFHASRFKARKGADGDLVLYGDQDESLWNQELITKGAHHFRLASVGSQLTKYHLEAGIAWLHTIKADTKEKWENILQLYNHLLQVEYSPIAALNRTYALSRANGKMEAIAEAEKLKLTGNPYYFTLLGELYTGIDDGKAKTCFQQAFSIARTEADRKAIRQRLDRL
jgi:RNA polymerase sigma factor (sigma-70 family)